ncbi:CpaF family protein [Azospirillum sp.]|uniref:CpaF family protein n=1 Tax=Azospirillum sp. TaxID=34012 RepID=UPI003D75A5AA
MSGVLFGRRGRPSETPVSAPAPAAIAPSPQVPYLRLDAELSVRSRSDAAELVRAEVLRRIDHAQAAATPRDVLRVQLEGAIDAAATDVRAQLNARDQAALAAELVDDMLGLGPIEPLLARADITEIMVNGPTQVWVEIGGRLLRTDITFRDEAQLQNICRRIVGAVGRRVDESSPICDARLADGSRVSVVVPPLALDGTTLTIRKFAKERLTVDKLIGMRTMSRECALLLNIASRVRCNILVSGGTGSGKTTLLNCLTSNIDHGERIITIEDSAELQLQQPHVVRLETRPPSIEGTGEVTMRTLLKASLRMRPERIIIGEVRGPEAIDLLQAMNTGHPGSMSTVHANSPREALSRLETMVAMGSTNLPARMVREQIAMALDLIVQVERLRDGSRKVVQVSEVVGMEGDVVTLQDLMTFQIEDDGTGDSVVGTHRGTGIRPRFWEKARIWGLHTQLAEVLAAEKATS